MASQQTCSRLTLRMLLTRGGCAVLLCRFGQHYCALGYVAMRLMAMLELLSAWR